MQTHSFQASEKLSSWLDSSARKLHKSKGQIIRRALEDYLEDVRLYFEAKEIQRTNDPKENISLQELKHKYKIDA